MTCFRKFIIFFSLCFCSSAHHKKPHHHQNHIATEGYYWREYSGTAPKDSVIVPGTTAPLYIGQSLHINPNGGKLIPGTLFPPLGRHMYYASGGVMYDNYGSIKILCSHEPNKLKWAPVADMQTLSLLNKNDFVLGGYDGNITVYIGSVIKEGHRFIGKITTDVGHPEEGMTFVLLETRTADITKTAFEILTYQD